MDPNVVPTTNFLTNSSGSLVAGGSASATYLRAYLDNTYGGNARVTSTFADDYTLVGPGGGPISLTAVLTVEGIRQSNGNSVGAGFLATPGSYFSAPASLLYAPGSGPTGQVSETLTLSLLMAPGDTMTLSFQIDLLGAFGTFLDFNSTVTLGFTNLPNGYYITSTQGFSGIGGPTQSVPEPAILASFGLGLAGLGLAARRRKTA
jgi:hypothetical protein